MENLIQEPVRNTIVQPTLKGTKIGNTASRLRPKSKKSLSNFDKSSMYKIQDPIEMSTVTRRYFEDLAKQKIIDGIIKRQNAMTPDNERMGIRYLQVYNKLNTYTAYDFEHKIKYFLYRGKNDTRFRTYSTSNKEYSHWQPFTNVEERTEVFCNPSVYKEVKRKDIDYLGTSDPKILECKTSQLKIPEYEVSKIIENQSKPISQTIQNTNVNFKISDEEKKSSENN